MLEVIKETKKILETRINGTMTIEEKETSYHFTFDFNVFSVPLIVEESYYIVEGCTLPATRIARDILNMLEKELSNHFLDNTNFSDGFGNEIPGKFGN